MQAVKALRRFPDDKANTAVRAELVALLQKYSGQKISADAKAWTLWVVKNDPASEKSLNASDGYDAAVWGKRLASIEWGKGDPERGRVAFTKATCAACHDGGRAVSPSLLGISKRFGRDDLLTAILQPSKDVSPRYRPTRVVTNDDKAYTGIIIYEATDGVILQTGADTVPSRAAQHRLPKAGRSVAYADRANRQTDRCRDRRPPRLPRDSRRLQTEVTAHF